MGSKGLQRQMGLNIYAAFYIMLLQMEKLSAVYIQEIIESCKGDPGHLQLKLAQFLLSYRSTLHNKTGFSPAELFLKRPLKSRFDLLSPSVERSSYKIRSTKRSIMIPTVKIIT